MGKGRSVQAWQGVDGADKKGKQRSFGRDSQTSCRRIDTCPLPLSKPQTLVRIQAGVAQRVLGKPENTQPWYYSFAPLLGAHSQYILA